MVKIENGNYVIELPEHGIRQDFNPETGRPFAVEAEAQAYQDAALTAIAQHVAAAEAAAQAAEQERLAAELILSVAVGKDAVPVGEPIAVTAEIRNGLGFLAPINHTFAVPILNASGAVTRVKGIPFIDGAAAVSLVFDTSGYYAINEAGINAKLPAGMHIRLPAPVEVTVFE